MKIPLPILIAFLLGLLVATPRAQDPLQGSYGVPPVGATPLPSSIRATPPTNSTSPGFEGQIAVDDLYLYSYHNNLWKKSPRLNLP